MVRKLLVTAALRVSPLRQNLYRQHYGAPDLPLTTWCTPQHRILA
jgi:hypothetical protein